MSGEPLPYRKIGQTDMRVTVLSMGGAGVGGMRTTDDDETAVATVIRALNRGINLLDTSPLKQTDSVAGEFLHPPQIRCLIQR